MKIAAGVLASVLVAIFVWGVVFHLWTKGFTLSGLFEVGNQVAIGSGLANLYRQVMFHPLCIGPAIVTFVLLMWLLVVRPAMAR